MRRFTLGDPSTSRRYMIVVTPKGLESQRVTPEQFAPRSANRCRIWVSCWRAPDLIKFLEKQPIGKAHLLAELKREPTAVSVLQATRYAADRPPPRSGDPTRRSTSSSPRRCS